MTARTGGTADASLGSSCASFNTCWNSWGVRSASRDSRASDLGGGVRCGRADDPVWRSRTLLRKRWLMSLRLRGFLGCSCILHPCRFHRALPSPSPLPAYRERGEELFHLDNVVQLSELIDLDILVIGVGDPFPIDDQAIAISAGIQGEGHSIFAGARAGHH